MGVLLMQDRTGPTQPRPPSPQSAPARTTPGMSTRFFFCRLEWHARMRCSHFWTWVMNGQFALWPESCIRIFRARTSEERYCTNVGQTPHQDVGVVECRFSCALTCTSYLREFVSPGPLASPASLPLIYFRKHRSIQWLLAAFFALIQASAATRERNMSMSIQLPGIRWMCITDVEQRLATFNARYQVGRT